MFHPVNNLDQLLLYLLRIVPKSLVSRITGILARIPLPFPFNVLLIRLYAAVFNVNLPESEQPPSRYHSLNEFFIRPLKPSVRPHDPDPGALLSPVDGRVMAFGRITSGALLQAKDWRYTLRDLLGDPARATDFLEGSFCTLYLSPSDCHRIHIPLDGAIESLQYIPGHLFPVNAYSVSRIQNLFVLNERLILYVNTALGKVAMVMVGATNVGKIRIFFDEIRSHFFRKGPFQREYRPEKILKRGQEVGCFELGSTVILLFEKDQVNLTVQKEDRVQIGKEIGRIRPAS
jgi:phosphatidylserine decarboxylase